MALGSDKDIIETCVNTFAAAMNVDNEDFKNSISASTFFEGICDSNFDYFKDIKTISSQYESTEKELERYKKAIKEIDQKYNKVLDVSQKNIVQQFKSIIESRDRFPLVQPHLGDVQKAMRIFSSNTENMKKSKIIKKTNKVAAMLREEAFFENVSSSVAHFRGVGIILDVSWSTLRKIIIPELHKIAIILDAQFGENLQRFFPAVIMESILKANGSGDLDSEVSNENTTNTTSTSKKASNQKRKKRMKGKKHSPRNNVVAQERMEFCNSKSEELVQMDFTEEIICTDVKYIRIENTVNQFGIGMQTDDVDMDDANEFGEIDEMLCSLVEVSDYEC